MKERKRHKERACRHRENSRGYQEMRGDKREKAAGNRRDHGRL